jgi:ABC-type transporter Mla subunit MlaD
MSTVQIDTTTFAEIAVAQRQAQDAWLACVNGIEDVAGADSELVERILTSAEVLTTALTRLGDLLVAAFHASEQERGGSAPPIN